MALNRVAIPERMMLIFAFALTSAAHVMQASSGYRWIQQNKSPR